MTLASPHGGNTPIDPESLKPLLLDKLSQKYPKKEGFMDQLRNTKKLEDVASESFDCVYLTGGHGMMYDFPEDLTLQDIIRAHFENRKIVSAVCHGVGGLLNVKLSDGTYLIDGRVISGYSWLEEWLARRNQKVPFNLEKELKRRGAVYKKPLIPLTSKAVEDVCLMTGQNPISSKELAKNVVNRLRSIEGEQN